MVNTLILTSQHATMNLYRCMYPCRFNETYGKLPRGCRILVLQAYGSRGPDSRSCQMSGSDPPIWNSSHRRSLITGGRMRRSNPSFVIYYPNPGVWNFIDYLNFPPRRIIRCPPRFQGMCGFLSSIRICTLFYFMLSTEHSGSFPDPKKV